MKRTVIPQVMREQGIGIGTMVHLKCGSRVKRNDLEILGIAAGNCRFSHAEQ